MPGLGSEQRSLIASYSDGTLSHHFGFPNQNASPPETHPSSSSTAKGRRCNISHSHSTPSSAPAPALLSCCQQLYHSPRGLDPPAPGPHHGLLPAPSDTFLHHHQGGPACTHSQPAPCCAGHCPVPAPRVRSGSLLAPSSLMVTMCCDFSRKSPDVPQAPPCGATSLPRVGSSCPSLPLLFSCWLCHPWLGGESGGTWSRLCAVAGGNSTASSPAKIPNGGKSPLVEGGTGTGTVVCSTCGEVKSSSSQVLLLERARSPG